MDTARSQQKTSTITGDEIACVAKLGQLYDELQAFRHESREAARQCERIARVLQNSDTKHAVDSGGVYTAAGYWDLE